MHADPDLIGLLALGEDAGTEDERAHVRTCAECTRELAELQQVAVLARSVGGESLSTPSPDVWARITDELGFALTQESVVSPPADAAAGVAEVIEPAWSVSGTPTSESTRRRARRPLLATIKEALARTSRGPDDLTARAELTPVDAIWSHASGHAELATDELGRRVLQVDLEVDLPASGVRQAWLIHRDDPSVRQTLGVLDGPHGLWTVPHTIDLEDYPILDISQQGAGELEHSGQTIVRGNLALAS